MFSNKLIVLKLNNSVDIQFGNLSAFWLFVSKSVGVKGNFRHRGNALGIVDFFTIVLNVDFKHKSHFDAV